MRLEAGKFCPFFFFFCASSTSFWEGFPPMLLLAVLSSALGFERVYAGVVLSRARPNPGPPFLRWPNRAFLSLSRPRRESAGLPSISMGLPL